MLSSKTIFNVKIYNVVYATSFSRSRLVVEYNHKGYNCFTGFLFDVFTVQQ